MVQYIVLCKNDEDVPQACLMTVQFNVSTSLALVMAEKQWGKNRVIGIGLVVEREIDPKLMTPSHYGKLVRDKIPEIISQNGKGEIPHHHQESGPPLYSRFRDKHMEEGEEIFNAPSRDQRISEFADAMQVLRDWALFVKITPEEVEIRRVERERERGSFSKGIILDHVDTPGP